MSESTHKYLQNLTHSLVILTISVLLIGFWYEFLRYSKEGLMILSAGFCAYSVFKQVNLFWLMVCLLFLTDPWNFFYCFNMPTFIFGCSLYFIQKAQGSRAKIEQDRIILLIDHLKYNLADDFFGVIQDDMIKLSSDSLSILVQSDHIENLKNNLSEPDWDIFKNILYRCLTNGESSVTQLESKNGRTYKIFLDKIYWRDAEAVLISGTSNENTYFGVKSAGQMILHNLSNDLNIPINIINGITSNLLSSKVLPIEIQSKLRLAYNSSEVMSNMITYLLELSNMTLNQNTPSIYKQFNPVDLLHDASCQADMYIESRDNIIQCESDQSLNKVVWGDSQCIKHAVSRVIFLAYSHTSRSKIKIYATRTHHTNEYSQLLIHIKFPFQKVHTLQDSMSILTKACFNESLLYSFIEKESKNEQVYHPDFILDAAISLSLVKARVYQSGGSININILDNKFEILIFLPISDTQGAKIMQSNDIHEFDLEEFPDGELPRCPSLSSFKPFTFC